ncbi:hypothetical protein KP509_29G003900 [Ceratopteris richardii]|uniref:DNA-directed RNA polymerase n=1 Tax=Ceratopteris richardii TaxID=49495 RepID=A0A8T2R5Y6_CERRI|nr:hypothetical protein KP509_29G003900 [Ceratopteris richardii]
MFKNERLISQQQIQWKCLESKTENKRLQYGRFAISPFQRGQASIVGTAIRRALLQEVRGSSITRAKFHKVTIHDVLVNLKEIVLKSDSNDIQEGFLSVTGPKVVTAGDTLLPSCVKIIDNSQYVTTITQPISLYIELKIEKDRGYRIEKPEKYKDGQFVIDAVFMPVQNVNYSIHLFDNGRATQEISFMEIWTNGSLTPHEALSEASKKLIELLNPLLTIIEDGSSFKSKEDSIIIATESTSRQLQFNNTSKLEQTLFETFIDQLELPARAFNCLKRSEIHTIADLLNYSREDLSRIKNFGQKSVDQVSKALWERFGKELPNKKETIT